MGNKGSNLPSNKSQDEPPGKKKVEKRLSVDIKRPASGPPDDGLKRNNWKVNLSELPNLIYTEPSDKSLNILYDWIDRADDS
jgi:hypothetical protein